MFFSVQDLVRLTTLGWHHQAFPAALERIPKEATCLLEGQTLYTLENLYSFLRSQPNAQEQMKIVATLESLAKKHGCELLEMRWWDINPGEHWLICRALRDGIEILVSFSWKMVVKGHQGNTLAQSDVSWVYDKKSYRNCRFHIGQPEYHTLVEAFKKWLSAPLPAWPHWATAA